MKLDRNTNRGGHGKYALVNMRKLIPMADELAEANRTTNPDKLPSDETLQLLAAFDLLVKSGIISLGNETPGDQFFVMKYKDKFTADGLKGYAAAVIADAQVSGDDSLKEFGFEILEEAIEARKRGHRIPD